MKKQSSLDNLYRIHALWLISFSYFRQSFQLILPNTIPTVIHLIFFGSESQELESVDSLISNVVISSIDDDGGTTEKLQLVQYANPPVQMDYPD